jgi:2-(3-amino-3-carboxypropyl)histidine synthase
LLPKNAVETVFLPLSHDFEKKKIAVLAERLAKMLKVEKLESAALCATIQFHPHLNELKKSLESRKIKCFIGKGRSVSCGQVLGCNYSAVKSAEKKADAVVFLGDGLFHPLGISFCTEKPVFAADPLQAEAKKIGGEMDLFFRKRTAMIEKARQAGAIAVWVSSKPGQRRMKVALELKKKIEEKGKMAFIFASDFINPDYILGVQAGAIVCTACPRIALDDSGSYRIPIVNPNEMLIALGEKKLEEYCFEEMQ